ncbi:MAG: hypothetical protein PHW78_00575 [Macromonas bipunctata]|nr:hypothetical protein [Macromonas bipunctata]
MRIIRRTISHNDQNNNTRPRAEKMVYDEESGSMVWVVDDARPVRGPLMNMATLAAMMGDDDDDDD